MNHALLLRLFLSPSFFSVHVALQYLRLYADNVGISHYLANRLREFSIADLVDVWGFICHLLITRPSQSIALETFVLETAERSTHIAMFTLFNCQASLHDLSPAQRTSPSFAICHRVLNRCQDIIFGDPPPTTLSTPYKSPAVLGRPSSRFWKKKVKPHLGPAIAGIGCVLAGAPGMPAMTSVVGRWAVDQGRIVAEGVDTAVMDGVEELDSVSPIAKSAEPSTPTDALISQAFDDSDDAEADSAPPSASLDVPRPVAELLKAAELDGSVRAAQTTPELQLFGPKPKSSRTMDPFGQLDYVSSSSSTPSVPIRSTPARSSSTPAPILSKYDPLYQKQLLRSHYNRSEVNFIQGLESISNRLLVVPKPARVSALRAELTALNNSLPAEVCMPMWCTASDLPKSHGHHRIVRIPPGESVVLNSAERAPYLLIMEILEDDLDFDPAKRPNRDLLTKIVTEAEAAPKSGSKSSLGRAPSFRRGARRPPENSAPVSGPEVPDVVLSPVDGTANEAAMNAEQEAPVIGDVIPPTPHEPSLELDEEMDLVEQIYGTDLKTQDADLSESIVLPPQPKNKMLEMKTWAASSPASPSGSNGGRVSGDVSPEGAQEYGRFPSTSQDLTMDEYSERMRTAASMLAQLNANLVKEPVTTIQPPDASAGSSDSAAPAPAARGTGPLRWLPGKGWILGAVAGGYTSRAPDSGNPSAPVQMKMKLQPSEVSAITERIMQEMLALEEERMQRMQERVDGPSLPIARDTPGGKTAEDESIVRRELTKADPSAAVFRESWAAKKARIRSGSPYGHLANWDCVSVIVKTGGDLRQEQLAVQLIQLFEKIWKQENVLCWVRYFRILVTGNNSGLVETITDSVSIHSIKKIVYARRFTEGNFRQVTLYDYFTATYGDPSSSKFITACVIGAESQADFAFQAYSIITYLLQIKDRHNGNILLDRDGHLVHIDFGFMLSNSPGNIGFEAAPFKLPMEYVEVLGGLEGEHFLEFKRLFKAGFAAAKKHCDSIVTLVELMQKDSTMPCFAAYGEQTANMLRDRFQPHLANSAIDDFAEKLIMTSLGSSWTRLYDSFQYYSQGVL
ncbi:Phosphatidylinositol 4-kinase pik1alpha (PI4-kinase)(PtdIns-4-kinase) [Tulasnella sp. 424]|nr:Phosphatidylinositol 4-kinase pik1alpha (PI4-kinase)(PtdIns-4-kinase) [Tulasnella sp. 424]